MVQRPESASFTLAASPAPLAGARSDPGPSSGPDPQAAPPPHHVPRWLIRMELFLRVMLRMCIGLVVFCAPWSYGLWDRNPILQQYSWLSSFADAGAVRGLVSGLGLLNLWIAFQDAIRHRDG